MLYAYVSPDTFLPMTSILASVAAFFVIFGRHLTRYVLGAIQSVWRR